METETAAEAEAEAAEAEEEAAAERRRSPAFGVNVSKESLEVNEGSNGGYQLTLSGQPTGDVNITVHVPDGAGVSVMRETIRFTQRNWNWRQTVVLSGLEDGNTRDEAPVTITHTVSGGGYDGVKIDPVTVTVRDDDERRVHAAPSALTVQQGQTRRYRISLEAEPSGPVIGDHEGPGGKRPERQAQDDPVHQSGLGHATRL